MAQEILEVNSTVAACVPYGTKGREEWIIAAVDGYDAFQNKYKVCDLYPESKKQATWILEPHKLTRFPNPTAKFVAGDKVLSLWFIEDLNEWSSMFYDATVVQAEKNLVKVRFRGENTVSKIALDKVVKKPRKMLKSESLTPPITTSHANLPSVHRHILPPPTTSLLSNLHYQHYFPHINPASDITEILKGSSLNQNDNNNNSHHGIKHGRDEDFKDQPPNKKIRLPPIRLIEDMIVNPHHNTFTPQIISNQNESDNKLPPLHINDSSSNDDISPTSPSEDKLSHQELELQTLPPSPYHNSANSGYSNNYHYHQNNNNNTNNNTINSVSNHKSVTSPSLSSSSPSSSPPSSANDISTNEQINILLTAIENYTKQNEGLKRDTNATSFPLQPNPIPL